MRLSFSRFFFWFFAFKIVREAAFNRFLKRALNLPARQTPCPIRRQHRVPLRLRVLHPHRHRLQAQHQCLHPHPLRRPHHLLLRIRPLALAPPTHPEEPMRSAVVTQDRTTPAFLLALRFLLIRVLVRSKPTTS